MAVKIMIAGAFAITGAVIVSTGGLTALALLGRISSVPDGLNSLAVALLGAGALTGLILLQVLWRATQK